MTVSRRDKKDTPFDRWVRGHPGLDSAPAGAALSITDIDYCIHKYIVRDKSNKRQLNRQHIMLLETKEWMAEPAYAQSDTFNAIHQMLRASHHTVVHLKRGHVKIFYHGIHLLQFSATCPDDSDTIRWDGKKIAKTSLLEILRFERDARTLRTREDRSHHKAQPALSEEWMLPIPTT